MSDLHLMQYYRDSGEHISIVLCREHRSIFLRNLRELGWGSTGTPAPMLARCDVCAKRKVAAVSERASDCPNDHEPGQPITCWHPGGPCPAPNDPACDTCGPCFHCTDRKPSWEERR